jgi:hypothetical protein
MTMDRKGFGRLALGIAAAGVAVFFSPAVLMAQAQATRGRS